MHSFGLLVFHEQLLYARHSLFQIFGRHQWTKSRPDSLPSWSLCSSRERQKIRNKHNAYVHYILCWKMVSVIEKEKRRAGKGNMPLEATCGPWVLPPTSPVFRGHHAHLPYLLPFLALTLSAPSHRTLTIVLGPPGSPGESSHLQILESVTSAKLFESGVPVREVDCSQPPALKALVVAP